jgi:hypothetical protein
MEFQPHEVGGQEPEIGGVEHEQDPTGKKNREDQTREMTMLTSYLSRT